MARTIALMVVSEDALVTYYEVRSQAEQRCARSGDLRSAAPDALRDASDALNVLLYRERLGNLGSLAVGEVGVGTGDFIRYAFEQNAGELVLMDISRDRLAALGDEFGSRPDGRRAKLIVANAQSMDGVDDGELDLVVAKEVIEHLTDYRPFLRECHRVLRPGGRLYLTTPNRHCIDLWLRRALRRVAPPNKRRGTPLVRELFGHLFEHLTGAEIETLGATLPPGFKEHIHEFAPNELLRALADHGLQPMAMWGTPPQMFFHELRPLAAHLLPRWNRVNRLSYALGDNLRVIAQRASD